MNALRDEWLAFLKGMGERQRIDVVRWAYIQDFVSRALEAVEAEPETRQTISIGELFKPKPIHWSGDPDRCRACGLPKATTACATTDCPQMTRVE